MTYLFHFYPTLLNAFANYKKAQTKEAFQQLIDRINRVPERDQEILKKFRRGNSFEKEVLQNKPRDFSPELINNCHQLLPHNFKSQYKVSFLIENIHFYGYADVVGQKRIIDLKSTSYFFPDRHKNNFQNLYLFGLKEYGFEQMEYLTTDGKDVYHEIYALEEIDFSYFLEGMKQFSYFLMEHRSLIQDKKILQEAGTDLFS